LNDEYYLDSIENVKKEINRHARGFPPHPLFGHLGKQYNWTRYIFKLKTGAIKKWKLK